MTPLASVMTPNQPPAVRRGLFSSPVLLAGLLVVAVVAGAALRLHRIGAESLWLDEAFSVEIARGSLTYALVETAKDVHPPLYYLALHYWVRLAGHSEAEARALSALCSLLTMVVAYLVASRIFDRATGLVATVLLAVSPFQIDAAQEARMYTFLALMSALSMLSFLKMIEDDDRWAAPAYVVFTSILTYIHAYSVFVIAAQLLYLCVLRAIAPAFFFRAWRRCLLSLAIVFVLFQPWFSTLARQVLHVEHAFWIPSRPPSSLWLTLGLYAGSTRTEWTAGTMGSTWMLLPLASLAVMAGTWRLAASRRAARELSPPAEVLLFFWLACPILLPFLISRFSSPIFLTKYTIAASVAFAIIAARGVTLLFWRVLQISAVALVIYLSVAPLSAYYAAVKKDRWREMVASVELAAEPNDVVLFNRAYARIPFDFYRVRPDLVETPFLEHPDDLTAPTVVELLRLAVRGHDRVWLVLAQPDFAAPLVRQELQAHYRLMSEAVDRGIDISLYVRKASAPATGSPSAPTTPR